MGGTLTTQVGVLARRAMLKTLRQPFQIFPIIFFPLVLLAVNASGLKAATRLPGFPTNSYVSFAIAVAFIQGGMFSLINTGTNLAEDIESGFFNRLALTPLHRVSLISGLLVGVAGLGVLQSAVYILMSLIAGAHLEAGLGGAVVILALGALTAVAFGAFGCAAALRTGSGEAVQGLCSPVLRVHLPVLEQPAAQPAEGRMVPHGRDLEPDLLPDRGLPQPLHLRLGRHRAAARLRRRRGPDGDRAAGRHRGPAGEAAADMRALPGSSIWRVAFAISWRSVHTYVRRPDLFVPSLIFPLVFLASFAGGLSALGSIRGFHFAAGYTAFQFVFVLCQSAMFAGLFTGFSVAFDFESGFSRRLLLAAEDRRGIALGYAIVALTRGAFTLTVITVVALVAGMRITGDGVDVFGLYGLAALLVLIGYGWAAGVAFRFRSIQAGPLMQTPVFLLLFLAPVYVPISLLQGWIHGVAQVNPATAFLEAGRGLISGAHDHTGLAFIAAGALIGLFAIWMLSGLRKAEAAG